MNVAEIVLSRKHVFGSHAEGRSGVHLIPSCWRQGGLGLSGSQEGATSHVGSRGLRCLWQRGRLQT